MQVPLRPPTNTQHPNTTKALAHLHFIAPSNADLQHFAKQVTTVVGHPPISSSSLSQGFTWELISPASRSSAEANVPSHPSPKLILSVVKPGDELEETRLPADHRPILYEVAFWADQAQETKMSPFGRIRWQTL